MQRKSFISISFLLLAAFCTLALPGCRPKPTTVFQPLHEYTFPIDSGDERYYTTIQSDCGQFGEGLSFRIEQSENALHLRVGASGYAGFWHSVNGRAKDIELTLRASSVLPAIIKPAYQPHIKGLYVRIKGTGTWKIELKAKDASTEYCLQKWGPTHTDEADYVQFTTNLAVPEKTDFKLLNIVVEANSDLWFDEVGFIMSMPLLPDLDYAFLTSACQVFRCHDPVTGFVRDKSFQPAFQKPDDVLKYVFNTVPGQGFATLTAATAADRGFVETADAVALAQLTIERLVGLSSNAAVAHSSGFLPHWICVAEDGVTASRHPDSEFSTVDTALAYLSAYAAAAILGLAPEKNAILNRIQALDFDAVTLPGNQISHGFDKNGQLISSAWTNWGGETALLMILAKMNDPVRTWSYCAEPPVFSGRGFIQELAPLLFARFGALPEGGVDGKGVDWYAERLRILNEQKAVLDLPSFFGGHSCAEIIDANGIQFYLEGGSNPPELGGVKTFKHNDLPITVDFQTPWIAPHYPAMTAALEPDQVKTRVAFMRTQGLMHPMCGPPESVLLDRLAGNVLRRHTKQVALNGWFSAVGYYHALAMVEDPERDLIYNVTKPGSPVFDQTLYDAVQSFWNEEPQSDPCVESSEGEEE